MSMWMLTEERKNELLRQKDAKLHELDVLKRKTKEDLWREDLDAFMEKLDSVEEKERKEAQDIKPEKKGIAVSFITLLLLFTVVVVVWLFSF